MQRPALLVLVRHAESQRNAAKLNRIYLTDKDEHQAIRGIPDYKVPLTDKGLMQAKEAGERIRDRYGEFDYAYHSGYLRTMETLEHILEAYPQDERDDIQIRMNPFIRERDSGYTYDMTEE